jgi:DNA end-binding protein Ku
MRAMWKGSVSFGLVTIPIQLYAATQNNNISMHQVHETDGARIQYKRFCSAEGVEVPYAEIAKGYELDDGEMVVLTDGDLADLPLSSSRTIEVLEFVDLEAIDPIYFDRNYYLEPQKNQAAKPYVLLRDALHKSGHVAIAKVSLRQRETLAVLRVYADVLVLTTMLWPDEVRTPDFPFLREDAPQVRAQELTMAGSLIDSLTEPVFEPDKFHDSYREALEAVIQAKVTGEETTRAPAAPAAAAEPADLMSVLAASVSAAKKNRTGTAAKPAAKAPAKTAATSAAKPAAKAKTPAKSGTATRSRSTASGSAKAKDDDAPKTTRSRRKGA